jgi:hypothetical protein
MSEGDTVPTPDTPQWVAAMRREEGSKRPPQRGPHCR